MKKFLLILWLIFLFLPESCLAMDFSSLPFKGIEVSNGFGWTELSHKGEYHLHTLSLAFNFDLKPLLEKVALCPNGFFLLQIEPYAGWVSHPETNIEFGDGFILKWGLFPEKCPLQPYLKAGLGFLYMSQTTVEQSTQFNFFEKVGMGCQFSIKKNIALIAEGFYRHVSNGGVKEPNLGINSFFISLGFIHHF